MKYIAFSSCCVDFYPQIDKRFVGGNSLNVASVWKHFDPTTDVSIITCLGNDDYALYVKEYLFSNEFDMSRIYQKEGCTANNKMFVDEYGERHGIKGTWNGGVYESFYLSNNDWDFVAKHDVVCVPANNPNFNEMLKQKHKEQLFVVDYLDVLNNVPVEDSLQYADIAFLTATPELLPVYESLAYSKNKLFIISMGSYGSYTCYNGKTYHQPALEVENIIDTTGCGDAYLAAFSMTYCKTKNIKDAMYNGAYMASKVLEKWGGAINSNTLPC